MTLLLTLAHATNGPCAEFLGPPRTFVNFAPDGTPVRSLTRAYRTRARARRTFQHLTLFREVGWPVVKTFGLVEVRGRHEVALEFVAGAAPGGVADEGAAAELFAGLATWAVDRGLQVEFETKELRVRGWLKTHRVSFRLRFGHVIVMTNGGRLIITDFDVD